MTRTRVAAFGLAVAVLSVASVAMAGHRGGSEREGVAPRSEHVTTSAAGYRVQVHPAFSSGISVRTDAGRTQLFRQQATYTLPAGQTAAPAQHVVRLQGGAFDRDLGLVVNDPKHQIARITVEMYGPDHKPGQAGSTVETFVVENRAVTCPPDC
jgi:hypothetical protein